MVVGEVRVAFFQPAPLEKQATARDAITPPTDLRSRLDKAVWGAPLDSGEVF